MKIAMFTDYYAPTLGGIQTSIKSQKEALEAAGHSVIVLCPGRSQSGDATIIYLPTYKYYRPDGYPVAGRPGRVIAFAIAKLEKLEGVELVHVHSDLTAGVAGLIAARRLNLPVIISMHTRQDAYVQMTVPLPRLSSFLLDHIHGRYIEHDTSRSYCDGSGHESKVLRRMRRLMVSNANFADHVVVPSRHFRDKLARYGVIRPMSIISNGLEASILSQLEALSPLSWDGTSALKVMWCGRFSPEKRPLEFLKALPSLGSRMTVDLYGDGLIFKQARALAAKLSLDDVVRFRGSQSQVSILTAMRQHHILVYTSYDFDNQPMVLLEAVAAGLPVLYCDPDLSEIMPISGAILAKSPRSSDITQALYELGRNHTAIESMSTAMLSHRVNIEQTRHLDKLIEIYQTAIRQHHRQPVGDAEPR